MDQGQGLLYVFPAHAGMSLLGIGSPLSTLCFPRSRGDEPQSRMRVVTVALVFPAHAGMSPGLIQAYLDTLGFPRSRGDEPNAKRH